MGGLPALLLVCACAGQPESGPGTGPAGEPLVMPPALPARAMAVPAIAVPEAAAIPAIAPEPTAVAVAAPAIAPEPPAPAPPAAVAAAAPVAATRPAIAPEGPRERPREGPRVQLVAAGSEAEARAHWSGFVQRLPDLAEGREPYFVASERPGQAMIWRLRVGGFADAGEARAWCERLRARGGNCWVAG